jgi:hypothetical protein
VRILMITLSVVLLLDSCAASPPEPVIDMQGVDPAQYSRDLAGCYQNIPFAALGNPVSTCMESKGYVILEPR